MTRISSPLAFKYFTLTLLAALVLPPINSPAQASGERTALGMLAQPVASDKLLKSLIGTWKGPGTVKLGSDSDNETLKCRTTNAWAAGKKLMKMTLVCIGVDYRFRAIGFIGRTGGQYRGDWETTVGQSASLTGRRSGAGLVLTLASNDGKSSPSTLRINLAGKQMTNKLVRRDRDTGKTYTAFKTTLQK
ncbi:MAG: hypothetical protein ACTSY1_02600 [Alphaproteobacteria bacterium]